ncbi:hypothetical protein BKA61DRAFT_620389 [Leptodontidium sp. MPI-SDFR-AT-0119]|nr:hypothetical protein BKA61DRAFT_620389 [Leptodontidium sp. MPI-SDFR-AT-0119]
MRVIGMLAVRLFHSCWLLCSIILPLSVPTPEANVKAASSRANRLHVPTSGAVFKWLRIGITKWRFLPSYFRSLSKA